MRILFNNWNSLIRQIKKIKAFIAIILLLIFPFAIVNAMESVNYKIDSDSVNIGGTDDGQSASYYLKDTVGESAIGESGSASYIISAGYRAMLEATAPTFSFSLSASSCVLGLLSFSSVSSCDYTVTSSTNTLDGYATTIIEDGNLRDGANNINDIIDGTVTAGAEEYGIGLTGADRTFADEEAITGTALTIASDATGPIAAQAVTVIHKASITSSTLAGSYSHIVTLISTGTF